MSLFLHSLTSSSRSLVNDDTNDLEYGTYFFLLHWILFLLILLEHTFLTWLQVELSHFFDIFQKISVDNLPSFVLGTLRVRVPILVV
ncbi:hypothetical protein [Campylobacter ureolyticus]|uniref:hypothetical protein n=1 Tax=Campylobacter ureolyticus TaxID=827 RepID=UPI00292FEBF1|nr:hypothetical protein [Campylobacter ureolyticus]